MKNPKKTAAKSKKSTDTALCLRTYAALAGKLAYKVGK
jgi:hypothetical protein